jgi:scyllo-inositol 2-dehydrogenase (NADP+)
MAEATERFGCIGCSDPMELIKAADVDVVVVASPSRTHAGLAIECLRDGKSVVVEKPFAGSLTEADAMIAAAATAERHLIPSHNLRYSRAFQTIRGVIESGKLGSLVEVKVQWHAYKRRWDWQTIADLGGGALNNDGSHVLDQVIALFGSAEREVFCRTYASALSAGGAEDHAKIILTGGASPLIDIELTNLCAYPQATWLILGVNGSLLADLASVRWRYIDPAVLPVRKPDAAPSPDRSYNREDLAWTAEEVSLGDDAYVDSHRRMYTDLANVFRGQAAAPVPLDDIRRQLQILDRCRAISRPAIGEEDR